MRGLNWVVRLIRVLLLWVLGCKLLLTWDLLHWLHLIGLVLRHHVLLLRHHLDVLLLAWLTKLLLRSHHHLLLRIALDRGTCVHRRRLVTWSTVSEDISTDLELGKVDEHLLKSCPR